MAYNVIIPLVVVVNPTGMC